MKRLWEAVWAALAFGNFFIALCAAAQGGLTFILLRQPLMPNVLLWLFCATFFVYNFRLLLYYPKFAYRADGTPAFVATPRNRWVARNRAWLRAAVVAASLALVPLTLTLPRRAWLPLACLGCAAVGYSLPFLRRGNAGLRQIPFLKVFIIGAVWAGGSVLAPYAASAANLTGARLALLLVKRSLFVIAITLPFDIRDLASDHRNGLRTFATLLGATKTKLLALALLALNFTLTYLFDANLAPPILVGLLATWLAATVLILYSGAQRGERYFLLGLDGLLLLQFVAVFACCWWVTKF